MSADKREISFGSGGTMQVSFATAEQLKTATEPLGLCGVDYEVVQFVYDALGSSSPSIVIVLRHRRTAEQTCYRFSGVKLNYLPPVLTPSTVTVFNSRMRGWEAPRNLQVAVGEDHPDAG